MGDSGQEDFSFKRCCLCCFGFYSGTYTSDINDVRSKFKVGYLFHMILVFIYCVVAKANDEKIAMTGNFIHIPSALFGLIVVHYVHLCGATIFLFV